MEKLKLPKLRKIDPNRPKKKKIILLSDDLRLHSGVGTVSREIVFGTVDTYDWVQIAGAVKHPEQGQAIDISSDVSTQTGVDDASVKLYPTDGYGNPDLLRHIIAIEKPDVIMHFTDPRFWGWLYNMEHEIRQTIPLVYLNIWDDLPAPHWNRNAYESCDLLMAISKQTYNLNRMVLGHGYYESESPTSDRARMEIFGNTGDELPYRPKPLLTYVPHGINQNVYKPLSELDNNYLKVREKILGGKDVDFLVMFNSRNIRRKCTSNLILAFKLFVDTLPKEQKDKCVLLLHTDPVDNAGTDLPAVCRALAPDINVIFSNKKVSSEELNCIYNMADVVCNPSSAEGFGLSHMEAIMSGTPTIATVLGGLQDQMGFKVDGAELQLEHFTDEYASNSQKGISTEHGEWVYPLWPMLHLVGSPATPYIYDSIASIDQIRDGLIHWYNKGSEGRKASGLVGREWAIENGFTTENMAKTFKHSIEKCLANFKKRERFTIFNVTELPDITWTNCHLIK